MRLTSLAPYGIAVRTSNKGSFMGGECENVFQDTFTNISPDRHAPGKTYWPFFTTTKTVSARWDEQWKIVEFGVSVAYIVLAVPRHLIYMPDRPTHRVLPLMQ